MQAQIHGGNDAVPLAAIIHKLANVDDPDHMQELAELAIDMQLRRSEDKALRDMLVGRAHIATSGLIRSADDPLRRQQTVLTCIELMQSARERRQPRVVVLLPDTRPRQDKRGAGAWKIPGLWPIFAIGLALVLAFIAGVFALASPGALPEIPVAPANATASPSHAPKSLYDASAPPQRFRRTLGAATLSP